MTEDSLLFNDFFLPALSSPNLASFSEFVVEHQLSTSSVERRVN